VSGDGHDCRRATDGCQRVHVVRRPYAPDDLKVLVNKLSKFGDVLGKLITEHVRKHEDL